MIGTAHLIDAQPGNGTRYRLVVVLDPPYAIRAVAWPEARWSAGDFGLFPPTAEWLQHSGGLSEGDAVAIAQILGELRDELERADFGDPPEPVLLRVLPEHRAGRALYWRAGGAGYTYDLTDAGQWHPDEVPRSDRAEVVTLSRARDEHVYSLRETFRGAR